MAVAFAACAGIGYYLSRLDGSRQRDLNALAGALYMLKSEIMFSRMTLSAAFADIAERTGYAPFADLGDKLGGEGSTRKIWMETFREHRRELYFSAEDYTQIEQFGRTLGALDVQTQLESIDHLTDYLKKTFDALEAVRPGRKRMFIGLGTLSGLLVAVLFI